MENVNSVEQLESLCANTPLQLFYCDKHFSCATSFQRVSKYQWAIQLECGSCKLKWHVCKSCNIRAKMVTARQLQLHHKKYHCEAVERNLFSQRTTFQGESVPNLNHGFGRSGCSTNLPIPQQTTIIPPLPPPIDNDDYLPSYDHEDDLDSTNAINNNMFLPVQLGRDTANELAKLKTDWGLNRESQIFFENLREGRNALGCLVGQAHFLLPNVGGSLQKETIQLYLHYAFLLRKVTPKLQCLVSKVLREYHIFLNCQDHKQGVEILPFNMIRQLPFTPKEIRSSFFKGKYSLFPNMPLPHIHRHHNTSHSYVLPTEVIAWFLGFAKTNSFGTGTNDCNVQQPSLFPLVDIWQTKRVMDILHYCPDSADEGSTSSAANVLHLFLSEWGDDFEPNYGSHNRGSIFIKTITIIRRRDAAHESSALTFPVILGEKGDRHDLIESIIDQDLKRLRSPLFLTPTSQSQDTLNLFQVQWQSEPVQLYVDLVASICDQPARREYVGISAGAGRYAARWGYVGNWVDCQRYIPFCLSCKQNYILLSTIPPNDVQHHLDLVDRKCDECTGWMYDINHTLLRFAKPKDYPKTGNPPHPLEYKNSTGGVSSNANTETGGNDHKLIPFKMDFEYLKIAVRYAHDSVVQKTWSLKEAKMYLKTIGLSEKFCEEITDCADNCLLLNDPSMKDHLELHSTIQKEMLDSPQLFTYWKPPITWSRPYGITLFNNAPMHLLSGVSKTTHVLALEWIKPKFDRGKFITKVQELMTMVHKLGLTWCRLPPKYGGKFVAALSENKVNLTRISCWLFSVLPQYHKVERFTQPAFSQRMWLKRHNLSWLKERGLDTSGSADVVRDRVKRYLSQPEANQPKPLWITRGNVHLVLNVIHRMSLMFTWILRPIFQSQKELEIVDIRVRMFLQFFHEMDREVITGEAATTNNCSMTDVNTVNEIGENIIVSPSDPSTGMQPYRIPHWITSYNFLSLLNLKEDISQLGPLRSLWEGGFRGEKYISEVKPLINTGLTKDWSQHLMKRLWLEKSVEEVESVLKTNNVDTLSTDDHMSEKMGEGVAHTKKNQGSTKMYCRYDGLASIGYTMGRKEPLSVILHLSGELYFVIQARNGAEKPRLMRCVLDSTTVFRYCGMIYKNLVCHLAEENCVEWDAAITDNIREYGILLPLIYDEKIMNEAINGVPYYTLITDNWSEEYMDLELICINEN